MPGVSIPSITESELWPICVHTLSHNDTRGVRSVLADDKFHYRSHVHPVIKKLGNIRIFLKCVQS